jgi:hypothetical protein
MDLATRAAHQFVPQPAAQTDCYRLMVFNGAGTHVLLGEENDKYYLPEIRIPQFTRSAEQITSGLRDTWGIPTVLLFSNRIESDEKRPY